MENPLLIGFDIGGTKCAAILGRRNGDGSLEVLGKSVFRTHDCPRPSVCLEELARRAETLLEGRHAAGIGVSCGGPLSSRAGVVLGPPNLPGWNNVPVTAPLAARFGCPARLQNDANAGALAEWKAGAGRGCDSMAFLTFGTGLGAGLILNGHLYAGADDLAGECGHLRLAPFGPVGFGKSGSFEGFCSGGGIAQLAAVRAREILQRGGSLPWCRSIDELGSITAKSVGDAADASDEIARAVYAECGGYLGKGLAILIDLLNLDRIVIGSIFARSEHLLRPAMEREIAREALPAAADRCRIVPAQLGESIGDIAALAVAAGEY